MSAGRGGRVVARRAAHTEFVTERALHEPDILVADGYGNARPAASATPERALMLAVLEDACRSWMGAVRSLGANSLRQRELERRWIVSEDTSWPFSFVNICEALDLDAGALRARLLSLEPREGERVPQARRHIVRSMSDRIGKPRPRVRRRPGRERTTRLAVQGFGRTVDA